MLDGVDVGTLPLPVLRRRLGIVPQQPFIFSGSLRFNLDPLRRARRPAPLGRRRRVHTLRPVIELLEKNTNQKAGLDIWLSPERLSLGQRPDDVPGARRRSAAAACSCSTRRRAALDMISDRDVQVALRKSDFVKRATVLAVAHRVHSVIDSNRILVMNAGKVAEFEPPLKLVKKPTSLFRQLWRRRRHLARRRQDAGRRLEVGRRRRALARAGDQKAAEDQQKEQQGQGRRQRRRRRCRGGEERKERGRVGRGRSNRRRRATGEAEEGQEGQEGQEGEEGQEGRSVKLVEKNAVLNLAGQSSLKVGVGSSFLTAGSSL